jgi:hypothetical protein
VDKKEARAYIDRWAAVHEIEIKERRVMTPAQRWEQFRAIMMRARALGISKQSRDLEFYVSSNWTKLRTSFGK